MKAISLHQPWASLWLTNSKVHETRAWEMRYRGWLAVHAAKRIPNYEGDLPAIFEGIVDREFGEMWRSQLPRGAIIGAVHIVSCGAIELAGVGEIDRFCGDYSPGRFAIKRDHVVTLKTPIPEIGRQRYWNVSREICDALCCEISRLSVREASSARPITDAQWRDL